jgi:hypothetical protein
MKNSLTLVGFEPMADETESDNFVFILLSLFTTIVLDTVVPLKNYVYYAQTNTLSMQIEFAKNSFAMHKVQKPYFRSSVPLAETMTTIPRRYGNTMVTSESHEYIF